MSEQPKRPYFRTQFKCGKAISSSFMSIDYAIMDALTHCWRITDSYVIDKRRNVFAKIETIILDDVAYAAVTYTSCPSCNHPNYFGNVCHCCAYDPAEVAGFRPPTTPREYIEQLKKDAEEDGELKQPLTLQGFIYHITGILDLMERGDASNG